MLFRSTTDVAQVTGTVTLAGALALTDVAAAPVGIPAGVKLTILTYTGGLTGTFTGLAEGATVVGGANSFKIRYADASAVTLESLAVASGYAAWATAKGLTGANNGTTQDPDHDGMTNLTEYYFDGNPLASDPSATLPTATLDATYLTLTFKRRDDAEAEMTTQLVQYGPDVVTWPKSAVIGASGVTTDANGVVVTVIENAGNPDGITVKIPRAQATGGKLFGRVKLVKP